ncbi:hypothetical protein FQN55_006859 [Onygenales sp. PD_40]|nr:hypothetical protein FQN55_006859 [Onygenales sp. PD_40]
MALNKDEAQASSAALEAEEGAEVAEPKTPPGYTRDKPVAASPIGLPIYNGKSPILYKDRPPFDPTIIQSGATTVKIDVSARIAELQWYLRQPEYEQQHPNMRAVISYYKDGKLPREDGASIYFKDGEEYHPKPGPATGGVEWVEGSGFELVNSAIFNFNLDFQGAEVVMEIQVPVRLGGNGNSMRISALNDPGSQFLTPGRWEALHLGWTSAGQTPRTGRIHTAGGTVIRQVI